MSLILFVCTGNTCRSPMAEALFLHRQGDMGWKARSAGVFAELGAPASRNSVEAMAELGIDISRHQSQPLTPVTVKEADMIITMSTGHAAHVCDRFPEVGKRNREPFYGWD